MKRFHYTYTLVKNTRWNLICHRRSLEYTARTLKYWVSGWCFVSEHASTGKCWCSHVRCRVSQTPQHTYKDGRWCITKHCQIERREIFNIFLYYIVHGKFFVCLKACCQDYFFFQGLTKTGIVITIHRKKGVEYIKRSKIREEKNSIFNFYRLKIAYSTCIGQRLFLPKSFELIQFK